MPAEMIDGERMANCPDCDQAVTDFGHECAEWEAALTSADFSRRELLCSKCNAPLGLIYGPKGIYMTGHNFCKRCSELYMFEKQHAVDAGCGQRHDWVDADDDGSVCSRCGVTYDELVELSGWHDEEPSQ